MKSILAIILFFVGAVAMAAPTEVEQRVKYTTSLNAMASTVMTWYGSLIAVSPEQVSFQATSSKWSEYRSQYPEHITQIHIKSSDLTSLESKDDYQFIVNSLISYQDDTGAHTQSVSETFIFHVPLLAKPVITTISNRTSQQVATTHTSKYNRSYFKAREFSYAWLAFLDGVEESKPQGLNNAQYSMTMRGKETLGSITHTLSRRQHYLTTGGHLLRSLNIINNVKKSDADTYVLDLILEWKGVNHKSTPVLAKIHQEIEYKILDDKSWSIITIKEHHLLPDTAPWIELLC